MTRWNHAMCDDCWLERQPERAPTRVALPKPEFCGWCAKRTESGIYIREDAAVVPFPDSPIEARAHIRIFRQHTMPGTAYVDTARRRIYLDRMSDSDAVFVSGEFRRMEAQAAARHRGRLQ